MKRKKINSKIVVKTLFCLSDQRNSMGDKEKSFPTTGTVTSNPTTSSFTC